MVEDATKDAGLGDEGDHAHDTKAAGTEKRIDFVHPANEPGPSQAKGGQGWGHRGERQGRLRGRAGGGRLCFPGLAAGLQLAADDVGVGAVVVNEVPSRIGNVGEESGEEVEGVEHFGSFAVVAIAGQMGGGLRPRIPAQTGEAHGALQAVAGESLEGAAVAGGDGH